MTKLTLAMTRVRMLHFTKQNKDTLQQRMVILYDILVQIY